MITPMLARLIVREHLHRPIERRVLCLGRQTIGMDYQGVLQLFGEEGYQVPDSVRDVVRPDTDRETRAGKGRAFITDRVFFGLLGVRDLQVIDVSDYEGAAIVHDLNEPVPEALHGSCAFIVDGGTFDHVFDVRQSFENVVRLLEPGGRVFHWNAASNFTGQSYLSFGPDLFYDYYVLNGFADCKCYVAEGDAVSQPEHWDFYLFEGAPFHAHFPSARIQMVIVLAEKGVSASWDRMPVQLHYRDRAGAEFFREARVRLAANSRRPWSGAPADPVREVVGFRYVGRI